MPFFTPVTYRLTYGQTTLGLETACRLTMGFLTAMEDAGTEGDYHYQHAQGPQNPK